MYALAELHVEEVCVFIWWANFHFHVIIEHCNEKNKN